MEIFGFASIFLKNRRIRIYSVFASEAKQTRHILHCGEVPFWIALASLLAKTDKIGLYMGIKSFNVSNAVAARRRIYDNPGAGGGPAPGSALILTVLIIPQICQISPRLFLTFVPGKI